MTSTAADPLVGRLLDARYELERVIASGGMATVYLGMDLRLERRVAVKVMRSELAADPGFVRRFAAEARAAAALSHPDVVSVMDQGRDGPVVFLVMEFVAGRTLREVLETRGRLSAPEAAQVMEHVLSALGAAHRAGIVHRDVKPENVLMADDGRVKVADFGLARAISAAASTRTMSSIAGTVSYLSPEQVETGTGDARSDVYAAGILLFELLTGEKPYVGDSPMSVVYQHVHSTVPAPSSRVSGVPEAADRLVEVATRRDPAERPADATALLALLTRSGLAEARGRTGDPVDATLVAPAATAAGLAAAPTARPVHKPATAGPAAAPARTAPRLPGRRRRRGLGWVLAAVVLAAAAGLGFWAWYAGSGPGAATTVPSLLTLSQPQAEAKAKAAGLTVAVAGSRFDESAAAGTVISTQPGPGAQARKSATVQVVLSKGRERLKVPALDGTDGSKAATVLAQSGLSPGTVTQRYSEDVPGGKVVSTDPAAGSPLKRGTAVAVVVSKGPAPVPVPSLVGTTARDAAAALTSAGLKGSSSEAFSSTVAKGVVISQKPDRGTALRRGSTVSYVVSKGPDLVRVPAVTGISEQSASSALRAAGFQVTVERQPHFGVLLGRVVRATPSGMQPRGSTITITVF